MTALMIRCFTSLGLSGGSARFPAADARQAVGTKRHDDALAKCRSSAPWNVSATRTVGHTISVAPRHLCSTRKLTANIRSTRRRARTSTAPHGVPDTCESLVLRLSGVIDARSAGGAGGTGTSLRLRYPPSVFATISAVSTRLSTLALLQASTSDEYSITSAVLHSPIFWRSTVACPSTGVCHCALFCSTLNAVSSHLYASASSTNASCIQFGM
mmetsp:Transcript_5551/g.14102  ORF Transcript_5551/g.14102 Transcript_5551/m.14102 type:complete len:214 (-) Transcript_5551:397-1038(-)